jgi:hypothetical protein
MTQTLMASFEDDEPENVFPATETVLFLGGPKHGEDVEVVSADRTWKVFAKAEPSVIPMRRDGADLPPLIGSGGMQVHTYLRRPLSLQNEATGEQYVRDVFVHEAIPNPQVAQQLLMAALLGRFILGGRRVIDSDVSD